MRLEECDYEIEYKKGKENTAAGALSQLYPITNEEIQSNVENPDYYDKYIDWKINITPAPITQKPKRPHFKQITRIELGDHNEKNEILVSVLIQTESTISELHINIDEIFNTVMLGKQGIINPQVIEPEQFLKTLDQITRQNFMTDHIEPSVQNFQLILDLSKLKVWIRDNKLIYTITVPCLENNEWKIIKIYPIPSKQNSVFIAPVIETDLILTNSEQYTFADSHYLNKYCKRTAIIHICKRTQPSHNRINSPECRSELISNQQTVKTCPIAIFKLEELTFVPLQTENHYIIIPTKNVLIDVLYKTRKILEIRQPSLISSKTGCIIAYDYNIMKIGGSHKNISYGTKFKNSIYSFEKTDVPILEKILETAPKVTHNFN